MTSELVARLRRTYRREYAPTGPTVGSIENRLRPFPILAIEVPLNPDGPEAADEIERLTARAEAAEARVKVLEKALVEAAIPLEAMRIANVTQTLCAEMREGVESAVQCIRAALGGKHADHG